MAFCWADFLTVATALKEAGDEASLRAAVSRAYYAVFGEAKEAAETETGAAFPTGSIHDEVCRFYDGSSDVARRVFAANLRRLKSARVRADYYRKSAFDVRFADQALTDATKLLADLTAMNRSEQSQ